MAWARFRLGRRSSPPLATPLSKVDPSMLEVLELDATGRRRSSPMEGSYHELPYAPSGGDPGSLAGLWEGLANS